MKFVFIAAEKAVYPVGVLCDVLEVSRSGYYAWSKRPEPVRAASDAQLRAQIAAVHAKSRSTYGSPRVHAELRSKGVRVGKKRVERLMREDGIKARQKRRFRRTTDSNHTYPIAPNAQQGLGDRCDVHRDRRGLAVPRGDPRPVLASRGRLGHQRHQ